MKRRIPDPILIIITLLALTGFQAYWLKDNYDREKRTMNIKAGLAFQETIRQLQIIKLKLPGNFLPNSNQKEKTRIFVDEDINEADVALKGLPRREIITMVNTLRNSVKNDSGLNPTILIAKDRGLQRNFKHTSEIKIRRAGDSNHVFNLLYKVDSLQDSLTLPEIIKAYTGKLKKDGLNIQFAVTKSDTVPSEEDQQLSEVTVGFAHPVSYQLKLLNTAPYLIKKITLPILFSLFLVGVTIFSFVLLYRNLLRQQKLAEIKNDFISNITHELKTPIATVGVAIEALKNFNAIHDPQKTKEYLDISANELHRLGLLVDKVLKLSMFEKKEIELNKESFDLKGLIQEVLDTMRLQFEKSNAVVNFNSAGDNFIIKADKLHITSVIYNLLDNALKYSRENLIINIQLSQHHDIFEVKISDNGIGIAKEYKDKIFDKFFRVPTGNKQAVKGYGLGLSYVSEIIKRHMGYIYAESELGNGSTFIAQIPVKEAEIIWFDDNRSIRRISMRIPGKKKI